MTQTTQLACACGKVRLEVRGAPIVSAECHCSSCRDAGGRLEALPAPVQVREPNGGTRYGLYRKDRVRFVEGSSWLKAFRLKPGSGTRRVVATCCNSPVFVEFENGHWLSLYSSLWRDGTFPPPQMRTMTGDLPDASVLADDVPHGRRQSVVFFVKLVAAWIAMGLKVPKITAVSGEISI